MKVLKVIAQRLLNGVSIRAVMLAEMAKYSRYDSKLIGS